MRRLTATLLRIAGWMLALTLVAVALVALLRAQAIDDADRAALALMKAAPPPLAGSNGFAALMAADHDLPVARRDAALADDVAAFAAWERETLAAQSFWGWSSSESHVAASFSPLAGVPARSPPPAPDTLCPLSGEGCLQRVAADPEGTRQQVDAHAARIAAVEAALAADHIASPYAPSMVAPLPPLQHFRLPLAAAALDAVEGRTDAAYARTCRLLAAARRTDRQARGLIDKMVAQGFARGAATLLLDLRRAYPRPQLPGECAAARVAVDAGEATVCEALRGEFRLHRAHGAQMRAQLAGWRPDRLLTRALLVDDDLQAVAIARELAPACADDAAGLALQGRVPEVEVSPPAGIECWAAYVSCVLARIATPAYDRYGERALDHAAVLRLLLAGQRVADGDASPARAAVEAGVDGYPVEYDAATQRATVTLQASGDPAARTFAVDFAGLAPVASYPSTDAIASTGRGPQFIATR